MKLLSKKKGYTIVELIVGILISLMVIAYAISTSFFIKSRYSGLSEDYINSIDYIRLKNDLTQCFEDSEEIEAVDSVFVFRFKGSRIVKYSFLRTSILRNQNNSVDTFYFNVLNLSYSNKPKTNLVSELQVEIDLKAKQKFNFTKEYPVDIFVKNFILNNKEE